MNLPSTYEKLLLKSFGERLFNAVRIAERHEVTKNDEYLCKKPKVKYKYMMDLGCGDGTSLFHLYRKMASHVVGVDINKAKLQQAIIFGGMQGLNCSMVNADASHLPFKEETFNLIFSNCVLEHVPDDQKCFEEAQRILLTGGEFIATVPNLQENIPAPCVKLLFERLPFLKSRELSKFNTFDQALPVIQKSRWKHARMGYSIKQLMKNLETKNFRVIRFSFFQTGACRFFHNLAVTSRLDDVFPANFILISPLIHIFKFLNNGPEQSCAQLAFRVVKV